MGAFDGSPSTLSVTLGRLTLPNPVLVASGTFGYAREMEPFVALDRLGAILPKSITRQPRKGNRPPRTVETAAGLLNAIGLDNDGADLFVTHHLPFLRRTGAPLIVSIAGATIADFVDVARQLERAGGVQAIELNISCPNVSGGVDFGTDAALCHQLIRLVRNAVHLPIIAKLTPNVTDVASIARAAADAGADAVSAINTVLGMAVDWKNRRPMLANVVGGLSGPAIKPIALRCVYQIYRAVPIPIIGIGGIANIDDAMEFFVAGASAIQVGTANYYRPDAAIQILDALPQALQTINATSIREVVGTLQQGETPSACLPGRST
jgi:dihydroorotate dehydrogenase (NAD+) catalytic subunit